VNGAFDIAYNNRVKNPILMHNLYLSIFLQTLYDSGASRPITSRYNRMYTTIVTSYFEKRAVWNYL